MGVKSKESATEMTAPSNIVWIERPKFAVAALASKDQFDPVGLKESDRPKALHSGAEVLQGRLTMFACLGHTAPGAAAELVNSARIMLRSKRGEVARRATAVAKTEEPDKIKYVESAADKRLFEQVYLAYTEEYLKGPLYIHEDKFQGVLPDSPGNPIRVNGKLTSNVVGNLKTFSSNELAFFSLLFFGIGLYGHFMFNWGDPQIIKADAGAAINGSYIFEALCLPVSFFMHIACFIQKRNGK